VTPQPDDQGNRDEKPVCCWVNPSKVEKAPKLNWNRKQFVA